MLICKYILYICIKQTKIEAKLIYLIINIINIIILNAIYVYLNNLS